MCRCTIHLLRNLWFRSLQEESRRFTNHTWIFNLVCSQKQKFSWLYKILSDCHYVDEINDLLNAFRWKKKKLHSWPEQKFTTDRENSNHLSCSIQIISFPPFEYFCSEINFISWLRTYPLYSLVNLESMSSKENEFKISISFR